MATITLYEDNAGGLMFVDAGNVAIDVTGNGSSFRADAESWKSEWSEYDCSENLVYLYVESEDAYVCMSDAARCLGESVSTLLSDGIPAGEVERLKADHRCYFWTEPDYETQRNGGEIEIAEWKDGTLTVEDGFGSAGRAYLGADAPEM